MSGHAAIAYTADGDVRFARSEQPTNVEASPLSGRVAQSPLPATLLLLVATPALILWRRNRPIGPI